MRPVYVFLLQLAVLSCQSKTTSPVAERKDKVLPAVQHTVYDSSVKTIHVLVALCDNRYQGIVPVPPKIGNGQDPANNLYWGCGFGVKTFFTKSANWVLVKKMKVDSIRMERLVFRHRASGYYLIADAYDGQYIKTCTGDFLESCAGQRKDTMMIAGKAIGLNGNARLLAYIGHDGLMDFTLPSTFTNTDGRQRDAIILACISKKYFAPLLGPTKARPLVWSTGLMAPEAYTLHDALEAYISKAAPGEVRSSAARAYARYQKCGEDAAMRLLVGE